MKKKFEWEEFEGLEDYHYAYYDKEELGYIMYWKSWKKWVWCQNEGIMMSIDCLQEVINKLNQFALAQREELG